MVYCYNTFLINLCKSMNGSELICLLPPPFNASVEKPEWLVIVEQPSNLISLPLHWFVIPSFIQVQLKIYYKNLLASPIHWKWKWSVWAVGHLLCLVSLLSLLLSIKEWKRRRAAQQTNKAKEPISNSAALWASTQRQFDFIKQKIKKRQPNNQSNSLLAHNHAAMNGWLMEELTALGWPAWGPALSLHSMPRLLHSIE